jgi:hypothetical protein
VLSRPAWRWAAAGSIVVFGSLLAALSLRPQWFLLPVDPASDSPLAEEGGSSGDGAAASSEGPRVTWEGVEGAVRYRVRLVGPSSASPIYALTTAGTAIELPPRAAACLAPAASCELIVEALAPEGHVIYRQVKQLALPERNR